METDLSNNFRCEIQLDQPVHVCCSLHAVSFNSIATFMVGNEEKGREEGGGPKVLETLCVAALQ